MERNPDSASASRPQAAPAATAALPRVAVRMYRQGLGDCFLVTLRREDGTPWRMLIDCGVILGTPDTTERLKEVIANLVADTGGRLDVLVITHEHYDHVAAFAAVPNLFCADDTQRKPEQLQIGEAPMPRPGRGEVLIRVKATAVNYADAIMVAGRYQTKPELPFSPGLETAGVIEACGPDVQGLRPGDRVTIEYSPHLSYVYRIVLPEPLKKAAG